MLAIDSNPKSVVKYTLIGAKTDHGLHIRMLGQNKDIMIYGSIKGGVDSKEMYVNLIKTHLKTSESGLTQRHQIIGRID